MQMVLTVIYYTYWSQNGILHVPLRPYGTLEMAVTEG